MRRFFPFLIFLLAVANVATAVPTASDVNYQEKSYRVTWNFDTSTVATPLLGVFGTCSAKVDIAGSDVITLYQTNASTATGGTSVTTFSADTTAPVALAIGQKNIYATSTGATGGTVVIIECSPTIVSSLAQAYQNVPSTTTGSDRVAQNITIPAAVKYGYGVVTEGGPPYTFSAKNYSGSSTDGSEPDNQFGFYYNRTDVLSTLGSNMFEHAWDWSFENSYRSTAGTADETWVEHNLDIRPPEISAPTTGSSTGTWAAGDILLFSGGGTGKLVSVSGSDPTKTIVWRQNFGTTAAGETVSNITHATSAATLGALTSVGVYWRPYLAFWNPTDLNNLYSFYWFSTKSAADASIPTLEASSGHAKTKGRVIPGTVAAGTSNLGNTLITTGSCATLVTTTATGALTTDTIRWSYASAPSAATSLLIVNAYTTANNVNFSVCNPTGSSQTPSTITVNWLVDRWL